MNAPEPKLIPLASEGFPFIFGFLGSGIVLFFLPHPIFSYIGTLLILLGIFCVNFFRDPYRTIPSDPGYILSPGDGKVMEVGEEQSPYFSQPVAVVKIFLSVFDVHIQRSPISGEVIQTDYRPGKFLDARDPRASHENESHTFVIQNDSIKIAVKQIAGLIARRIVPWSRRGDKVMRGERIGLIRFGSQVDLYFPKGAEILVKPGDRVVGGISVIAFDKAVSAAKDAAVARSQK